MSGQKVGTAGCGCAYTHAQKWPLFGSDADGIDGERMPTRLREGGGGGEKG